MNDIQDLVSQLDNLYKCNNKLLDQIKENKENMDIIFKNLNILCTKYDVCINCYQKSNNRSICNNCKELCETDDYNSFKYW